MKTLTISMSAILLLSSLLFAEDANTYYHMGAQGYIGGKLGEAIAAVERGLELEPGHPELQALYEKLKEQQEQQQQNQHDRETVDMTMRKVRDIISRHLMACLLTCLTCLLTLTNAAQSETVGTRLSCIGMNSRFPC